MLGFFEGSPRAKLTQVVQIFATLAPRASCDLAPDGSEIVCRGTKPDGTTYEERLGVDLLPAELARHAAMRMMKVTQPAESIDDWERWASAWHAIQNYGAGAVSYADERILQLTKDGDWAGVKVFYDLRKRVKLLQVDPTSWPGAA